VKTWLLIAFMLGGFIVSVIWGLEPSTTRIVVHRLTTAPAPALTYIPPESSITPEGAKPLPPAVSRRLTLTNSQLVTPGVLLLLEQEEGYDRCAYWDPFGRVFTVGFGQTHLGRGGVPAGFCFASYTAAVDNLKYAVEHEGYLGAVVAVVGRSQRPGVYTGLISFDYNLGAGIFTGQLRADLLRHDYRAACAIQRQYDHAGGIVLADLARRRVHECDAILAPAPKPKPKPKPSRRQLFTERETLRRLLTSHHCRRPPWHSTHPPGFKDACRVWLAQGARVDRELA
jgi:GH24 family phage-related lysozyme (muramidase)